MNSMVRKRRSEPSRSAPAAPLSFIDAPPEIGFVQSSDSILILNPAYQVSYPLFMCTLGVPPGGRHGSNEAPRAGRLRSSAAGTRQATVALLHAADRRPACRLPDRSARIRRRALPRGLAR